MLEFFHDAACTVADKQNNPKRFLSPTLGLVGKTSVLYLADTYIAFLTQAASSGTNTLTLDKTDEFLASGTAYITSGTNTYTITYTAKTSSALTGVSGLTASLSIGDSVKPWKKYKSNGNFTFTPIGSDLNQISLAVGASAGAYNYPGSRAILTFGIYDSVLDAPIPIYISIGVLAGVQEEFINWQIISNPIYVRDKNDSSAIAITEIGNTITLYGYLFRRDNFQLNSLRLLPNSRAISAVTPGFIVGSYRWRDDSNTNSVIVTPTKWDLDPATIGEENFVSGIGFDDDLSLIDLENVNNSIYLRIKNGFYFVGYQRYFLPANPQIQFLPANNIQFTLSPTPNSGLPVFVGVWYLDINGFYRIKQEYRYQASGQFSTGQNAPEYQYILDKKSNLLQLNQGLSPTVYFLGLLSGQSSDFFDLPVYPIDSISSIYVGRGIGNASLYSNNYVFNRDLGQVEVISPLPGLQTSIPNANIGEPVYAVCNPAFAVVYDSGQLDQRLLTEIDLNPAFAGISSGYVYLQHRRQEPTILTLSADKPIIDIPATYSSIIDLIAYGPIYFNGDYSLLTLQAFGPLNNEIIPNTEVEIIPGSNFSGLINYQDPTTKTVTGITGADGKVNFLYTPDANFGYYIPTTAASGSLAGLETTTTTNDTIVLPTPIAIDKIYNTKEGWLVSTYNISNNDPLYGLAGGNIAAGQIPFATSGTSGTTNYQTNGEKVLWNINGVQVNPIDAQDSTGHSYTNPSFNGLVTKLIYNISVNTSSTVGAYFITFIQRVSLQVKCVDSNIISNTILLEMAISNPINQDPWLILNNSSQGILNQYRLGWQQDIPNSF
jgi:hypothetical protein